MKYFIGIHWYEIESGNSEIKAYSISNLGIECNFSQKWEGKNYWQDSQNMNIGSTTIDRGILYTGL